MGPFAVSVGTVIPAPARPRFPGEIGRDRVHRSGQGRVTSKGLTANTTRYVEEGDGTNHCEKE